MDIDEFTAKKFQKLLDSYADEMLHNPKEVVANFAGGMYCGMQKALLMLGIELENNKSE